MPYNPQTDANVVIGKTYHEMLKELTKLKGQTLKRGLEILIEAAHTELKREGRTNV